MTQTKKKRPLPPIRRHRRAALTEMAVIVGLCIIVAIIVSRMFEPTYQIDESKLLTTPPMHVIYIEPTPESSEWVRYPVPLDDDTQRYIEELCAGSRIQPNIVLAVIATESEFDSEKVGDSGNSIGLMQIYQDYHTERMERLGVTDLTDPEQNIRVGVDILRELAETYERPIEWTLMAYNGGIAYANRMYATGEISGYAQKVLLLAEIYDEEAMIEG